MQGPLSFKICSRRDKMVRSKEALMFGELSKMHKTQVLDFTFSSITADMAVVFY